MFVAHSFIHLVQLCTIQIKLEIRLRTVFDSFPFRYFRYWGERWWEWWALAVIWEALRFPSRISFRSQNRINSKNLLIFWIRVWNHISLNKGGVVRTQEAWKTAAFSHFFLFFFEEGSILAGKSLTSPSALPRQRFFRASKYTLAEHLFYRTSSTTQGTQ